MKIACTWCTGVPVTVVTSVNTLLSITAPLPTMGAAESNPVRNLDKRTARRQYKQAFSEAVDRYRVYDEAQNYSEDQNSPKGNYATERPVQCFIRKRPIFPRELKSNEFDVITCSVNKRTCTIHDARMHADMCNRFMKHHEFTFDRVFDESTNNARVYSETASKLVDLTLSGSFTTCLMYGQTGSGKTYTMSALYEHAAVDLFEKVNQEKFVISVSFVEIGKLKFFFSSPNSQYSIYCLSFFLTTIYRYTPLTHYFSSFCF